MMLVIGKISRGAYPKNFFGLLFCRAHRHRRARVLDGRGGLYRRHDGIGDIAMLDNLRLNKYQVVVLIICVAYRVANGRVEARREGRKTDWGNRGKSRELKKSGKKESKGKKRTRRD